MNKRRNPKLIDDDNPEWHEADLKIAVPFTKLPLGLRTKLEQHSTPVLTTKERITLYLSCEVLEQFRAFGEDWQGQVDTALKDWLKTHSSA